MPKRHRNNELQHKGICVAAQKVLMKGPTYMHGLLVSGIGVVETELTLSPCGNHD